MSVKTEKNFVRRVREIQTKTNNLLLEVGGGEEARLRRKVATLEKRIRKLETRE